MSDPPQTADATLATVLAFGAYLVLVLAIGALSSRFASSGLGSYFLAGRRLGRFVVALSAVVSGRSAWLLLGVTGMAYARGASAVWAVAGYVVVELLLFVYYAGRLRRFSERYDCLTLPDFFAARFADRSGALRTLLVVVILVFMVVYVAAQFVAGGKAFGATFGLPPTAGVLLTAAIVLVYTTLGGFLAVSLTDAVQAVFMLVALVALPALAISRQGGLGSVLSQLAQIDPTLIDPFALGAGALLGFLGIGLGSPGSPHILVRYMAIRDPAQLRTSALIGTIWNILMGWGALYLGLAGRAYFPLVSQLPGGDTENLYPALAGLHFPPALVGLVVASVFAAIMSTADSQLLVAASSIVRDLYQSVLRPRAQHDSQQLVTASRVVVFALVAAATLLALYATDLVFWLVLFAWAGLGAALGPTSILALFWRRTTGPGIAAGILVGTLTTFAWQLTSRLDSLLYELVPSFLASAVATAAVSLMTSRPAGIDEMFATMTGNRATPPGRDEDSTP